MKIKDGYMLREIAGSWIVVPIGQRVVEFSGLINLNESAVLLWKLLKEGAHLKELKEAILKEYDIDELTAEKDVLEFINILKEKGIIE